MNFIYCRGGDKLAPVVANETGMLYGIRYDYTAYGDVYMLDGGLAPRWTTYLRKARKVRPTFALAPDFELHRDIDTIMLYVGDLRSMNITKIGIAPKYYGAMAQIPNDEDIIVSVSIPTVYSGYMPDDDEWQKRDYHLLGGDIRQQVATMKKIYSHGGRVVSMDGNKIAMKASHGQIWDGERWRKTNDSTPNNTMTSAHNIMKTLGI